MLNHTYTDMMRQHPYGYALYEPESSLIVKPGALGYINNEGRWTPLVGHDGKIIDLSVPRMLVKNGLTVFTKLHAAVHEELIWGPKVSDKTKGIKVDFKKNHSLIPAGIPADISALYKFKTNSSFGAILMTANPVTHEVISDTRACTAWFKYNMAAILRHWPAVINHGLVIVTSIHKTAQADIKCWHDKRKEISIGFKFSAVEKGEIAPSSKWYKVPGDGWVTSKAPQRSHEQKVVFFGGLHWTFKRVPKITSNQKARSRASLDTTRTHRESNSFQSSYQTFYNEVEYSIFYEAIGNLSLETVDYDGNGGDDVNNSDDDAVGSDGADDMDNSDDDAGSDDAGGDVVGSDDAGSDDAADVGSDDAGSDDAGSDDAADVGSDDAASDDAGSDDAASDDAADAGSDGGGDADDGYGDD